MIVSDVDSHWLLSVLWCAGTDLVATHYIEHIQNLLSPILYMVSCCVALHLLGIFEISVSQPLGLGRIDPE